jgi:hypothetical protein
MGFYMTYYHIVSRYWWPRMYSETKEAVLRCGHCIAANVTSHKNMQQLQALSTGENPFDVISMDVWQPGRTGKQEIKKDKGGVLTSLCTLTGFASIAFLQTINSDIVTRLAFSHMFVPNSLAKLIVIDSGSEFKGVLIKFCDNLGIEHYAASPEDHNAILCEQFHQYLNKVQKIGAADLGTMEQWRMNTLFATYAWNSSPIDGTDLQRSFVAKAR